MNSLDDHLKSKFVIEPGDQRLRSDISLSLADYKLIFNALVDKDPDNQISKVEDLKFRVYAHIVELD